MAGEYPGLPDEAHARPKLRWLLENRVSFFLNLTEAGEADLLSYASWLEEEAADLGVTPTHVRMPIADMGVPTREHMAAIQKALETAVDAGRTVYVHCYGGIGRTGTVVGCYLVSRGLNGASALERIAVLRQHIPAGWRPSPETAEQVAMVMGWKSL